VRPEDEARAPRRVQAAAEQALKTYLDRFVRRQEREAESQHVELGWLEPDERVVKRYQVRVKANDFLAKIEKLLQKPLAEVDDDEPLPRFYVDWHLFNPVLAEGGAEWKKHVSIRPPALVAAESQLVRDLKVFWATQHSRSPYKGQKVFLLRNLPKVGVGLFHRSGFYPDFILWLKDNRSSATHVRFIDPHGLHHGGLEANNDKFEALVKLRDLSNHAEFKAKGITLDGCVLARTPLEQIPDRAGRDWPQLEADFPLMRQQGDYAQRLLSRP